MVSPKDFQPMFKRWEMTDFNERPQRAAPPAPMPEAAPSAPPPLPAAPMIALPTIEELEAIREAARQEGYAQGLQEGREQGLREGHASGYQDGLAQGRLEAADELVHLQGIAASFGDAVTQADEAIANDVLELAVHLAKNMVRTAFEVRPDYILPVVREAIDYLPTLQQPALLILNPEDALIVRDHIGHELEKTGWRVVEDGNIARGGCRIDTASNQIDAQIASRWERLSHAVGMNVDWLE